MIPSVEWVKDYRLKQIRFNHMYKGFLKLKATELTNKLIIDPIIDEMRNAGVSRKIYQNVAISNVIVTDNGVKINIHSEYWSEGGFDVAVAREEGTTDHMIYPKNPDGWLSWIQNGKRRFSKGHKVTGLPRLEIIERKIDRGEYELQQQLIMEFTKWKREIFAN